MDQAIVLFMKKIVTTLIILSKIITSSAQDALSVYNNTKENTAPTDWLIYPAKEKAAVYKTADGKDIVLYNGLVKRVFRLSPNLACIDYKNVSNNQQLLRAVKAEARLTINGKDYNIGGLYGQNENAYLFPEWIDKFKDNNNDFH